MNLPVVALVLAGASLLWNIIMAIRIDRASLKARVRSMVLSHDSGIPGTAGECIVVTVVNWGKRPTLLTSLWLNFGRPRRWSKLLPSRLRRRLRNAALMIPDEQFSAISSIVPCRLEPGDQASVFYSRDLVLQRMREHGDTRVYTSADATTAHAASRTRRLLDKHGRELNT